ncbi:maltokinase N-terminal cap-like domain-containing protein [Streptomyces hainanensis]|uniref:Maltokinase n=1 Tax=Streptomyces hainanensis TaxID=402648 RepID=A0A4R4TEF1_9ACTN|nr:aminoglycoside phosphotransferase [Streptomyces hainanensis]TDC73273.1 aminoglycoside phosphotransferase [Streptomyces hainanensis]
MTAPVEILDAPEVRASLAAWLAGQRWYAGGRAGRLAVVDARPVTVAPPGPTTLVLAVVRTGEADDRYQLLLGLGPADAVPGSAAVVAGYGDTVVYDALGDPRLVGGLVAGVLAGAESPGLRLVPTPAPHAAVPPPAVQGVDALPVRPLGVEQSNSSVVVGGRYLLKVFRRLVPGPNRDLTVHRRLAAAGCPHVPPLLGAVEDAASGTTYATLGVYLPRAVDGWALALAAAGSFLGGPAAPGRQAQADLRVEARTLGRAVAVVHRDLAAADGRAVLRPVDYQRIARRLAHRLDRAVALAPQLAARAPRLRAELGAVATLDSTPRRTVQRVHGDLHLGQTLHTTTGWLLVDFEGEPLAEPTERDRPDSPLRDLAGMLRSFDYAAHHPLGGATEKGPDDRSWVRAARWATLHQQAFLDGYLAEAGPQDAGDRRLLHAYLVDKAVYEVAYETQHRPGWAWLPERALDGLLGGAAERGAA